MFIDNARWGRRAVRLLGAACIAGAMAAAQAQGVLKVRPFGDLKSIDPIVNSDYMVRNHGYMVYDTLFALDDKLQVQPQMVDKHTVSADGLTYTFTLRDGLKFHDGANVTSADVVASLQRWGQRDGMGQQMMERTAELIAVDARTVRLKLKEPWGLVLDALGKPSSNVPFIMPERVAKTPATTVITDATGSGPFIMKKDEWVPGSKIVYIKNPAYVARKEEPSGLAGAKRVLVDRVEWLYIADAQTASNAVQSGEIDIFEELPPDMVKTLASVRNVKISPQDTLKVQAVFRMNSTQPPFDNPKVRQAMLAMIDQTTFMKAMFEDASLYKACGSFYMCSSPYYTNAGWPKADMARAKQLLKDSGYKNEPVVFLAATDVQNHVLNLVAAQMLREVGMNVQTQAMDWGTLTARRASKSPPGQGGWSAFITGPTGADMMDPLGHMALRSNCDKAWFGWPCDEQIEKLRGQFAVAPDLARRKEIAAAVQARALETVPYVSLGEFSLLRAYSAKLTGVMNAAIPVYWNIKKTP
jgi:peptide/nickel transport system substrate-binding protein